MPVVPDIHWSECTATINQEPRHLARRPKETIAGVRQALGLVDDERVEMT